MYISFIINAHDVIKSGLQLRIRRKLSQIQQFKLTDVKLLVFPTLNFIRTLPFFRPNAYATCEFVIIFGKLTAIHLTPTCAM